MSLQIEKDAEWNPYASYEEQIEALTRQVAEYTKTCERYKELYFKTDTELTAAQANIAALRDALAKAANAFWKLDSADIHTQEAEQALAIESHDDALKERYTALAERIIKFAADVVELYDDATMQSDYMLDSGECHEILVALIPYIADKIRKGAF